MSAISAKLRRIVGGHEQAGGRVPDLLVQLPPLRRAGM
jgi:hypothetical protein